MKTRNRLSGRRLPWLFMLPGDVGLFLKGARTDAAIAARQASEGALVAFEAAYVADHDPWGSGTQRYRYQALKYDKLVAMLPRPRYGRVLDIGCGAGLLSRRLAARADDVLGIDLAASAIARARADHAALPNLAFAQGDLLDLPPHLVDDGFDLIVVADVLYYLSPLDDAVLSALRLRLAALLRPGGTCLLVNHYFFAADAESRRSRRIHRGFAACPHFTVLAEHRRAFFLASLLRGRSGEAVEEGAIA